MKPLKVLSIVGLLIALLAIVAVDIAPASDGPTASVTKKKNKCSKKKRKKGKCGTTSDPVAALTALFSGSSFSSSSNTDSAGRPGTNTDVFKFCRNGTYTRHIENTGTLNSGTPYHSYLDEAGAWKFTDAEYHGTGIPGLTELKGGLDVTITSFHDSEGRPQVITQDSFTVVVTPGKPYVVIGDHPVWTPTPGGAGC